MSANRNTAVFADACAVALGLAFLVAGAEAATLSKFTGGDPGEGLDLTGTFAYALDFRSSGGTTHVIQDATFLPTSSGSTPPGVTLVHYFLPFNTMGSLGFPGPYNFGASSNDVALAAVMDGGAQIDVGLNNFAANLAVTTGQQYKLQLLMLDNAALHRPAYYTIDGAGTTLIDIPSDPASYPNASY